MNRLTIVVVLILFHLSSWAQSTMTPCRDHGESHQVFLDDFNYGSTKLGESLLVAEYEYTMVSDTILRTAMTDPYVLQISPTISKFSYKGKYDFDSGVDSITGGQNYVTFVCRCFNRGYYPFIFDSWITDSSSGVRTFVGRLAAEDYIIKGPITTIGWRMTGETKQISGYDANCAEGEIDGETWTVWYTEDVPVSAGPWKICGLPGLVLSASNKSGTHSFEITSIKDSVEPIVLSDYRYTKTTNERYQKLLDQLLTDYFGFVTTHNKDNIQIVGKAEERHEFQPLSR